MIIDFKIIQYLIISDCDFKHKYRLEMKDIRHKKYQIFSNNLEFAETFIFLVVVIEYNKS